MAILIWKQWQESKIHFLIFLAWMMLAVFYSIAYELGHHYRAIVGSFSSMAMLYSVIAAIVLAARASQGEQANGTLAYTKSLPVPLREVARVRIMGAVSVISIPIMVASCILAAALVSGLVEQATPRLAASDYTQIPLRQVATLSTSLEQLASVTAIAMLGGIELLLVLSLCGCWLRNQAQVGLLGAVLALGTVVASGLFWYGPTRWATGQLLYGAINPQSLVVHWGYGDATGHYTDHELAKYRWLALGLIVPFLAALAHWFVSSYGRGSNRSVTSFRRFRVAIPSILSFVAIPLPTRWMALIWLEIRQSLPLAFYGLLFAILVTISSQFIEFGGKQDFALSLRGELPHTVFFVGMLWAVVVGSGIYSSDLSLNIGSFRRSRPISHSMWFWTKFLVGLVAVLLALDGVAVLVSWNAPSPNTAVMMNGMSYAYVACIPIVHTLLYSLAVLGTCLFRNPLIGGISAALSFFIVLTLITSLPGTSQLDPTTVYNKLLMAERDGEMDFTQHTYPMVYGLLVVSIVVCSTLASHFAKPLRSVIPWLSRVNG